MREYFRYAGGATKTFGRLFKSEFDTIGKVAEERVKRLQTQYIKMGRDASGAMQAISITPTSLDMENYGTKTAIAAQKQALFNQLMKQGSTNLLNFGKNTQWAGRQLMVGFTIPLAMVGSAATKTFMDMEAQALKFKKVYGDLFTPKEETQQALDNIMELGKQFTKYGVAVSDTVGLAADAAAAGFSGLDLQRQTTEATRLSVLGQIDNQKALETTISLQNAFGMSSDKLADSINFLNAVENQTVVSLDDITTAIPKVAPVIQQLGGDVKDLTFFLAAMKEGGINASEGANALKSGLAALINPTGKASAMLAQFGINANEIVTKNKGNLKATVIEFATALNQLDPLNRAQAIEQMFGKFQFARLSTLFANVAKDGNQAARVLNLANASVEELSALSEQELGMTADSAMNKFKKTVEDLKAALIPVGKSFLEAVTPIVEFVGGILEKFADLSSGTKKAITLMVTVIGGLGPILLMTFGLLANGVANIIKLFLTLRNGYLRLTGQSQVLGEQTQYLTAEQIDAAAASHSLNQAHATLTQQFTAEASAVNQLIAAYQAATRAGAAFAAANPGAMLPRPRGYAEGVISVPGNGKGDTVPAMLTPGEAVIPAAMAKKYAPLINGMIAGNIPGYESGLKVAGISAPPGTQFGHITTTVETTVGAFLASLKNMSADMQEQHRSTIHYLQQLADLGLQTKKLTTYSGLGAFQGEALNEALGKGGRQVPKAMILKDMAEIGIKRWEPALAIGGAKLEEVNTELVAYETSLIEAINDFKNMHGKTTMSGQELEALEKSIRETLPASSKLKQALDLAADTITEFRVSLNKADFEQIAKVAPGAIVPGVPGQASSGGVMITGVSGKQRKVRGKGDNLKARVPGGMGTYSAIAAAEATDLTNDLIVATARAAGTQSPSKKTIPIGEDIARGLEVGMSNRKDDVATAGSNLGKAATQSTSRGARTGVISPDQPYKIEKTRGGVTVGEVAGRAPISPDIKQKAIENAKITQTATDRLKGLDRNIMGASFAISSLSALASMSGGALGNMAGVISKVTGALFALQAITGLLTQTNMLALVQKRAEASGLIAGNVLTKKMGLNTTLFSGGIKKLLPNLLNFGKVLARFLGPVGLAITAITATVSIIKLVNAAREREKLKIEGLGNAAFIAGDKLKTLGDFFGIVPQKFGFENLPKGAGKGLTVGATQAAKVAELRGTEGFQKDFGKDIQSLKAASNKQAELVFKSLIVQLRGRGFAEDQVKTIIQALQEESGKTDVKIDFKSLKLNTKEGQKELKATVGTMLNSYSKQFSKGYSSSVGSAVSYATGQTVTWVNENLSKGLEKSINTTSKSITGLIGGIEADLKAGRISAAEFSEAFGIINTKIASMPPASGMLLIDSILKTMGPDAVKAGKGFTNVSDRLLVLQAVSLGAIGPDSPLIKGLRNIADPEAYAKAKAGIESLISSKLVDQAKAAAAEIKAFQETANATTEKSPFQLAVDQLKQQRSEMLNTVKSYGMLRKAGVGAGKAFAIAKDPILAAALASTKVGTQKWKDLIKLIKETDAALIKSKLTELSADIDYTKQFTAIVPVLKKAGLNAEEIQNIFADPAFAQQFIKNIKNGKVNMEELNKIITKTMQDRNAKLSFETSLKTDDELFNDAMDKANDMFNKIQAGIEVQYAGQIKAGEDAVTKAQNNIDTIQKEIDGIQTKINEKQRDIEINITRKIEEYQASIDKLQESIKERFDLPLAKLSDEGDILSNTLSLIDRQESAINKKYDQQAAALTKISEINSEIAGQQKQQLGLADALSRGDIAAAAAAAQEMRATAAAGAQGRQTGILEAARTAELAGVTVNGMTRAQIEERQFQISQQSFALQQQRKIVEQQIADIEAKQIAPLTAQRVIAEKAIRDEEDKIYQIQVSRLVPAQAALTKAEGLLKATQDKLKADLDIIEQDKKYWADAKVARDLATIDQEEYKKVLTETSSVAKGVLDKILALNTTVRTTHIINTVYTSSGSTSSIGTPFGQAGSSGSTGATGTPFGQAGSSGTTKKMYGGKIMPMNYGGMVPKYMGIGGKVGSDTVPAMLTPGEFVMNKAATKRFGPMLENMNNSKYPSMIKDLTPTTYTNVNSSMVTPIVNNISTSVNDNSSTMYNYNVGINVNDSNASSNDIARAVIGQIKYIDSQRIRGQR
jgi:TP901 family phage tail tape measure protein